ncbi:Salutaridine reductase [Morella rubra]|uniref:Salutaridine reductase n=1 Tax=Morella rubra TaxID=262757 RepID=A0A6A1WI35_9ROSI|nr:Salutaridine reductase [Morella rubra]
MNPGTKRIAVVTGANKGIGFEISKQLASNGVRVILTARDVRRGNEAVEKLKAAGFSDVIFHQLDVTDPSSSSSLADFIRTQFGMLDILVNNAGVSGSIINPDDWKNLNPNESVGGNTGFEKEVVKQTYETATNCIGTNYYGIKLVTKELMTLLQLSNSPRIVNVSSGYGQLKFISNEKARKELEDVDGLTEDRVDKVVEGFLEDVKENLREVKGWPANFSAYIVSKAALNAYTRILAKNYPNIAINSVSPGYVKTDMNHHTGVLTVEQGAKGPVMLAMMPEGGPSGLYFNKNMEDCSRNGANKGIGFEIAKQLASNGVRVILTARDVKRGNEAAENLEAAGYSDVICHQLDVTDPASISPLADFIKTHFGMLDILVKNAGIAGSTTSAEEQKKLISNENASKELGDADGLTEEKVDKVVEAFLEDVKKNLTEVKGWPTYVSVYSVSKAALNAYTRFWPRTIPKLPSTQLVLALSRQT